MNRFVLCRGDTSGRASRRRRSLPLLLLGCIVASADAHDLIYRGGFETVADAPTSDAEAARFLGMATFGPTAQDIAHLRGVGYAQWLEQQVSIPPTLERPGVEQQDATLATPGQKDRLEAWLATAVTAPDQLRQRMAWALSQIMVATFEQSKLGNDPIALAEFYDMLARDPFGYYDGARHAQSGTYSSLLYDVTRTPAMGKMLTYIRNKKPNAELGTYPDENYAREVMQLFSIGLVLRHPDFSPIYPSGCDPQSDPECDPIPTYNQATVGAYAQVFTGWSYTSGFSSNPVGANWAPSDYQPMICYDQYHDEADAKVLLSYTGSYGNGSDAQTLPANNGCENDLEQGLAIIANHPNVAPFIARQLIQRFTSSNPSPAYIERVAHVFQDGGNGGYGDLAAVIKAVLRDPEARYGAAPPPAPLVFGKAREPLLKLTALFRAYHAEAQNGRYDLNGAWQSYREVPLGAPSVFNFYLPDYLPPGELGAGNLFGPEFQIIDESSLFSAANDLRNRAGAYVGNPNNDASTIALDLSSLEAVADDPAQLIALIDRDLMAGAMSNFMTATLTMMVGKLPANDPMTRVTAALQVVLASPEFSIQK